MMKRKDIEVFEVVFALYTITHCVDGMIDEIDESDLPESLRDRYRAVRTSISSLMDTIKQYRDDKIDIFNSACED